MKSIGFLILGLFLGAVVTGVVAFQAAPGQMLAVQESKLGFEETVSSIEQRAVAAGWVVPKIYDLQASLHKAGHTGIGKLNVISLCQPDHAAKILADDSRKMVTAMMPCRIGVFETSDGAVMVASMNVGLMSKMFGGVIEEVMSEVAKEEHTMLADILK